MRTDGVGSSRAAYSYRLWVVGSWVVDSWDRGSRQGLRDLIKTDPRQDDLEYLHRIE